jgi:hypothetical protein
MNASNFINSVVLGDALQAKDGLNDLLSARAFEALDAKKIELAQSLYIDKEKVQNTETPKEK